MQKRVHISRHIKKPEKIAKILSTFGEEIEYITKPDNPLLDLVVIDPTVELGSKTRAQCLTGTFDALQDMKDTGFSPFEIETSSTLLKNLALYEKRVALLQINGRTERIMTLIKAMGGVIVDEEDDPDFIVTGNKNFKRTSMRPIVVSVAWIEAVNKDRKSM